MFLFQGDRRITNSTWLVVAYCSFQDHVSDFTDCRFGRNPLAFSRRGMLASYRKHEYPICSTSELSLLCVSMILSSKASVCARVCVVCVVCVCLLYPYTYVHPLLYDKDLPARSKPGSTRVRVCALRQHFLVVVFLRLFATLGNRKVHRPFPIPGGATNPRQFVPLVVVPHPQLLGLQR